MRWTVLFVRSQPSTSHFIYPDGRRLRKNPGSIYSGRALRRRGWPAIAALLPGNPTGKWVLPLVAAHRGQLVCAMLGQASTTLRGEARCKTRRPPYQGG